MRVHIQYLLSCFLLLIVNLGNTQTLPFKNYTIENGLPQSTVYHAYQDQQGYLWAGTQGGVCSFDGKQFKIWDSQAGLPDNHVTSIHQSPDGTLWFGHRSGALSFLKDKKVYAFRHTAFTNTAFVQDLLWERNALWVATEGSGLYRLSFHGGDTTFLHFSKQNGLGSDTVNYLLPMNKQALYIGTSKGVAILDLNEKVFTPLFTDADFKFNSQVNALCHTKNGMLWLGTNTGLVRVNLKNKDDYKTYGYPEGLRNININDVKADEAGNIWLATNEGLSRLSKEGIVNFTRRNGLLSDIVYAILEDREGALWISQDDGLSQFKDKSSHFLLFTDKDGLIDNEVYSIVQHGDNYWVATARGVSIFRPDADPAYRFSDFTTADGLPDNFVYKLFVDSRQNIWMGTISSGAACYNPATGDFMYFNEANGLSGNSVVNINEDSKGRMWFALLDGGLSCYDTASNSLQNFSGETGHYPRAAWALHKDARGKLWFGTVNKGLMYLDSLTDNIVQVPGQENLTNLTFGSLSSDRQGNLWIASIGGGVFKYDGREFSQYGLQEGIKSNNPYFVFCDNDKVLLGTNTGLDIFDPVSLKTENIEKGDGFIGIETNQNAVLKDRQGDVWIGTVNGLMRYRAPQKASFLPPPPVHLIKQRLFFRDTLLPQAAVLSHREDYITFDFAGISLSNTEKLRYRYLLEGFDKEWSPPINDSYVTYTNLPPGAYTFKVKAGFENGAWSKEEASFKFSVMSPYWVRWWFIMLVVAAVSGLFYSFYRYRINQLVQVQQVKNNISADLHDDIGSRLTNIQLLSAISKSKLSAGSDAEAKEYLNSIDEEVQASAEALDEIVWNIKMTDENLEDMTARMRRYAGELLENVGIVYSLQVENRFSDKKMGMEKRRELFLIFKEILNNIRKHARATKVEILIAIRDYQFYLSLQDNGIGFDACCQTSRNGLCNMKERVKKWKGLISIASEKNKGTLVEVWIPFDKKNSAIMFV